MKISENTSVSMPIRNMAMIILGVAMGVFAYTEVTARLTSLETTMDKRLTDLENKFTPIGDGVYAVDPNSSWPPSRGEYKMKDEMSRNKIMVLEEKIQDLLKDIEKLEEKLDK